jgi:hypothetical protein
MPERERPDIYDAIEFEAQSTSTAKPPRHCKLLGDFVQHRRLKLTSGFRYLVVAEVVA